MLQSFVSLVIVEEKFSNYLSAHPLVSRCCCFWCQKGVFFVMVVVVAAAAVVEFIVVVAVPLLCNIATH